MKSIVIFGYFFQLVYIVAAGDVNDHPLGQAAHSSATPKCPSTDSIKTPCVLDLEDIGETMNPFKNKNFDLESLIYSAKLFLQKIRKVFEASKNQYFSLKQLIKSKKEDTDKAKSVMEQIKEICKVNSQSVEKIIRFLTMKNLLTKMITEENIFNCEETEKELKTEKGKLEDLQTKIDLFKQEIDKNALKQVKYTHFTNLEKELEHLEAKKAGSKGEFEEIGKEVNELEQSLRKHSEDLKDMQKNYTNSRSSKFFALKQALEAFNTKAKAIQTKLKNFITSMPSTLLTNLTHTNLSKEEHPSSISSIKSFNHKEIIQPNNDLLNPKASETSNQPKSTNDPTEKDEEKYFKIVSNLEKPFVKNLQPSRIFLPNHNLQPKILNNLISSELLPDLKVAETTKKEEKNSYTLFSINDQKANQLIKTFAVNDSPQLKDPKTLLNQINHKNSIKEEKDPKLVLIGSKNLDPYFQHFDQPKLHIENPVPQPGDSQTLNLLLKTTDNQTNKKKDTENLFNSKKIDHKFEKIEELNKTVLSGPTPVKKSSLASRVYECAAGYVKTIKNTIFGCEKTADN